MKKTAIVSVVVVLAVAAARSGSAQVTLTGASYLQTFNSIGSGLPPGWSVRTNATATSLGAAVVFTTNATSWSSTSGQFANYASTVSNGTNFLGNESSAIQSACTNRGPGLRQTGTFGDPGAAFVFQIQNTLGWSDFELSVDLNMLSVQTRSNSWIIDYGLGNNPTSFTPIWTNADPAVFGSITKTISFGGALDNQAQNVWIRVATFEPSAGGGSRDTFGIDNFKLSYQTSGTITAIPLHIELVGPNTVLTWSDAAFVLQAAPRVDGIYTNVPAATSPYTNPITGPQQYFRLRAG